MSPSPKNEMAIGCLILVVDDEEDVRLLLEREIRDLGHEVVSVPDANAAILQMVERPFDIVITDIRMPGMTGIELTEWIKGENPETDVIVITAYASVDTAAGALRLGAFDYLTKPFGEIELLTSSINRAVEKRALEQGLRERTDELERANAELRTEVMERKEAEEDVRRLSEFNQKVIASSPAALAVVKDEEQVVVSVNPAFCEAFDIAKQAVEGKPIKDSYLMEGVEEVVQKAFRTNETTTPQEMRFDTGDGGERWFLVSAAPIRTMTEAHALLVLHDTTERHR